MQEVKAGRFQQVADVRTFGDDFYKWRLRVKVAPRYLSKRPAGFGAMFIHLDHREQGARQTRWLSPPPLVLDWKHEMTRWALNKVSYKVSKQGFFAGF